MGVLVAILAFLPILLLAALAGPWLSALLLKYVAFVAFKMGVDPGLLVLTFGLTAIANSCGTKRKD
jgi:hypothetical protein